ncbi:hypothetical protein EF918_35190 [Streptomyces sp. WAC06614]|nr:hypothetical protein EF918_35190 [Streptomyces sp. WAC06614]
MLPFREVGAGRGALFAVLLGLVGLFGPTFLLLGRAVSGEPGVPVGLAAAVTLAATAAAGAALAVCAAFAARCARPVPPTRIRTAIRDREQRTAFLPQRDPDAEGRSRPRAPGRYALTAA